MNTAAERLAKARELAKIAFKELANHLELIAWHPEAENAPLLNYAWLANAAAEEAYHTMPRIERAGSRNMPRLMRRLVAGKRRNPCYVATFPDCVVRRVNPTGRYMWRVMARGRVKAVGYAISMLGAQWQATRAMTKQPEMQNPTYLIAEFKRED